MKNKINKYFEKFKKNHPIAHKILHNFFHNKIIILFFWGLIVWGIIIPHIAAPMVLTPMGYFFHSTDGIKPEIEGFFPNIDERLIEPPEEIKITFKDDGGSGIDTEKSEILLKGATQGIITEEDTIIKDNLIILKPNISLKPDAYNVYIKLKDRGGNIALKSYSFYVLENPELSVFMNKYGPNLTGIWMNQANESSYLIEYYGLIIHNDNNTFLKNIIFEAQFPGIIQNYSVLEDDGVSNLHLKTGESTISSGLEIPDIDSCYTRINIGGIAPGGILSLLFKIDLNFSDYDYIAWCRPGIGDLFPESNFENEYKVNYDYEEYGFWYHKNETGNISSSTIDVPLK